MSVSRTRHPAAVLGLIGFVFTAPLVAALLIYQHGRWQPRPSLHHGRLIDPPRALGVIAGGQMRGHWLLAYVANGACGRECRAMLGTLGRIRLAQGREMYRVQAAALLPGKGEARAGGDVAVLSVDSADLRRLQVPPGTVLIVDPLGNAVLAYDRGFAPTGVIEDLRRLLRFSQVG